MKQNTRKYFWLARPREEVSAQLNRQAKEMALRGTEGLVKSKQRVSAHGEVFTPAWMVDEMLGLIANEAERIDARILEPACGSGNFLLPVLKRKFVSVQRHHGKSEFEKRHYALFSLMCMYGIELLEDNLVDCRNALLRSYGEFLNLESGEWIDAAAFVLDMNIVQGDALKMENTEGYPLILPEWAYLGHGKYKRRDFLFDGLTKRSTYESHETLFGTSEDSVLFPAFQDFPVMSVIEIANMRSTE